jgi:four helix bundle protein
MGYQPIQKALAENPLLVQCLEFSVLAIGFAEQLEALRQFTVANQLVRCATSIGANAVEAQSAESKADFIHKMKIADKEAQEAFYWLAVCQRLPHYPSTEQLQPKLDSILRLLNSIIRTSKAKNLSPSN